MKKILLTTTVFFCISGVLMAQQKGNVKAEVQKKTPIQSTEDHNAKMIALKKAYKKNKTSGFLIPVETAANEVLLDKLKSTKNSN